MKGYSAKAWDKCTIRVRPNCGDLQRCFVQKEIFSFTRSARSLLFTQITSFCHLKVLIFVWAFTHWPCFVWVREEPSETSRDSYPNSSKNPEKRLSENRYNTIILNSNEQRAGKRMDRAQKIATKKSIQICNVCSEEDKCSHDSTLCHETKNYKPVK